MKRKDGSIDWEDAEFDIKNKTYEKLPEELKKRFNEYQLETIIHENCDGHRISKYIKRYNNHTPMNTDQKASKAESEKLKENLHRLESVVTEDIKSLFNEKGMLFDEIAFIIWIRKRIISI